MKCFKTLVVIGFVLPLLGISIAELKVYKLTGMDTFGLENLLVDCQKQLVRDKYCKLEVKAVVEE